MKNIFYILALILFLNACSSPLEKYRFPEITPSQSLIAALENSRQLIIDNESSKTNSFKIQFHGQSIVKGIKEKRIKTTLEDAFDNVDFEILNTARSGLQVPQLLPLIERDIYPHKANVLFFHAYGGTETGELDQYLKNLKENFKGDVIIFNHHLSYSIDKAFNEKLTKSEDLTSDQIEQLSVKYGFGFVDLRDEWRDFLNLNNELLPSDLLRDGIHPNDDGKLILESILMSHFIKAINQSQQ